MNQDNANQTFQSYDKNNKPVNKKSKLKWILILIVIVGFVLMIANAAKEVKNNVINDKQDGLQFSELNESVRDGKFEFVVKSFDCSKNVIGDEILNKTTTGKYCIADITVKNIGDEPKYLLGDDQILFNDKNQKFQVDSEAMVYLKNSNVIFDKLNPGIMVEGKLVFELPASAVPSYLDLHDSSLSDGVRVSVK